LSFINESVSLGFIVLAVDLNSARLKSTRNSIHNHYGKNTPIVCVVPKQSNANEVKISKDICPIVKGKDTVTSLINTGFKHGHKDWNIVVTEGVWVRPNLIRKYEKFLEDEKDIFFPVVASYNVQGIPTKIFNCFWDCTLDGIMIHQKTFKEIGEFDDGDLERSRLIWAANALEKGCKLKPILGARLN